MKPLSSIIPTGSARPVCRKCWGTGALEACQDGHGFQHIGECPKADQEFKKRYQLRQYRR